MKHSFKFITFVLSLLFIYFLMSCANDNRESNLTIEEILKDFEYKKEYGVSAVNINCIATFVSTTCNNIMAAFYKMCNKNVYVHGGIDYYKVPVAYHKNFALFVKFFCYLVATYYAVSFFFKGVKRGRFPAAYSAR